jgi:hypothetical protein
MAYRKIRRPLYIPCIQFWVLQYDNRGCWTLAGGAFGQGEMGELLAGGELGHGKSREGGARPGVGELGRGAR